jgi:hypothetical protein
MAQPEASAAVSSATLVNLECRSTVKLRDRREACGEKLPAVHGLPTLSGAGLIFLYSANLTHQPQRLARGNA